MKAKKVLSGALAAILLTLTPGVAVCAEEMAGQEQTENTQVLSAQEQENQEKAASYAEKIDTNEISNWPQGPAIYAASGIVMDMNSGAVLYAKKAEEKRYPASITKVLSVLTALQYAKMSDTVVFSEDSISFLQWDDAQIGMKPGEEISMESALYGMLLASANEVSYAVAENVGKQYLNGGYAEFIEEMNRISQELGCTSSNWVNANGLHDDNHYTTAHDMARIAAAAYQNEEFRRLETTLEYKVPPTNLTAEERILDQNHKMLWPENYYYYANAKAGKTGYTDQSKTTLVTMAEGNDMQLAAAWIDQMYAPLQSPQNNWGTYGEKDSFNIFEMGTNKDGEKMLKHMDLGNESPVEVREAQSVNGPLAVLNEYYDVYVTQPADAKWRLDNMHETYLEDMHSKYVYPNVFMSIEDTNKVTQYDTDIRKYAEQKKADWILNGGIEKEWDSYLKKMEQYGLSDYLAIKQKYFDKYQESLKSEQGKE